MRWPDSSYHVLCRIHGLWIHTLYRACFTAGHGRGLYDFGSDS